MNLNVNSRIIVGPDFVEKELPNTQSTNLVIEKYKQTRQIGKDNGFTVPAVLSSANNVIVFEKLDLKHSLKVLVRQAVTKGEQQAYVASLIYRCGQALAHVHNNLAMPDCTQVVISQYLLGQTRSIMPRAREWDLGGPVFLHGDFTLNNIFVTDNQLVILDPLPNNHSSFAVDEAGSRYLDISLFLNSINRQIGLVGFHRHDWAHTRSLRKSFVDGYEHTAIFEINRNLANAFSYALDCQITRLNVSSLRNKLARKLVTWLVVKNDLRYGVKNVL